MVQVNLSVCLTKHHAMRTYGGVEVYFHAFLLSTLDRRQWSASRPGCFTYGEKALPPQFPWDRRPGGIHSLPGRGGEEKKSHPCTSRESIPGIPARSLVTVLTELLRLPIRYACALM
jgi:hypothetical protein